MTRNEIKRELSIMDVLEAIEAVDCADQYDIWAGLPDAQGVIEIKLVKKDVPPPSDEEKC